MNNLNFFNENGFLILENIFEKKICDKINDSAKKLNDKDNFIPIMNIHNSSKIVMECMSHQPLLKFIENFFCAKACGLQTEYFFMPPKTNGFSPHQDNTYVQADSESFISAWIALTDINSENGGLIIWPKTHKENQLELIENESIPSKNQDPNARKMSAIIPEKYNAFSPEISKGSVIFIHSWLVHASNNNNSMKNRNALLCTYIKEGADFREGNYAKRKSFNLKSYE